MSITIHTGDCLDVLRTLPNESVHCCITSPPYYNLRDYGVEGQIGLETTPAEFIANLVAVFREVRRVLRDDGTCFVNMGDSYAGGGFGAANYPATNEKWKQNTNKGTLSGKFKGYKGDDKIKPKDLMGMPWRLAFALQDDGWWLRQDIIWSKPNPMPESVTDRCTKSHEYIFMLSKSARYYYDSQVIREPMADSSIDRLDQDIDKQVGSARVPGKRNGNMKAVGKKDKQRGHSRRHAGFNDRWDSMSGDEQAANGRNKRSVWEVATQPFSEAHFATFPPKLIEPCILAGCPKDGVVLDPFFGAGTTGLVADRFQRNCIGIELNPAYVEIARNRLSEDAGMFSKIEQNVLNKTVECVA